MPYITKKEREAASLEISEAHPRMLSLQDVARILGLGVSTITSWTTRGERFKPEFPRARKLGCRSLWLSSEIYDYMISAPVAGASSYAKPEPENVAMIPAKRGPGRPPKHLKAA